jgi:hypothetical protein
MMERKTFLSKLFSFSMAAGLVAGYGSFFLVAARFIFPEKSRRKVPTEPRLGAGRILVTKSPPRPGHDPVLYARPASKAP